MIQLIKNSGLNNTSSDAQCYMHYCNNIVTSCYWEILLIFPQNHPFEKFFQKHNQSVR